MYEQELYYCYNNSWNMSKIINEQIDIVVITPLLKQRYRSTACVAS